MNSNPLNHHRRAFALVLALLCCNGAMPAWAAPYACSGKVAQLVIDPNGTIVATFTFQSGGMALQTICNVNEVVNGVSLPACKAILATLMTARQSQQDVTMWFDNAGGSCNATPWKSIKDMGWYWGPSL